jgi:hypothetical protein
MAAPLLCFGNLGKIAAKSRGTTGQGRSITFFDVAALETRIALLA